MTYLSDAIGSESVPSYEAAIHLNYPLIGNGVMKVEEFLAAIDASGQERTLVQKGDAVRGSDHGEIGEVEEVAEATAEHEAYMLVPRGLIFETDTFIPLDAVVRRAGSDIFINVPKLVVGKMPWGEPPRRDERRAKLGPPAAEVSKLYGSRSPTAHETSGS